MYKKDQSIAQNAIIVYDILLAVLDFVTDATEIAALRTNHY